LSVELEERGGATAKSRIITYSYTETGCVCARACVCASARLNENESNKFQAKMI